MMLLLISCSSSEHSAAAVAKADMQTSAPENAALPAMEQTALDYIVSLSEAQKKKSLFSFEDAERKNWHFFPKVRGGLPLREMSEAQQALCRQLLAAGLSEQGQEKASGIMQLERILQELENRPVENDWRNPLLYYLAIFGTPGREEPWGWRLEGHHLSLNFSSVDRELAATPAFFGSNPAIVRSGQYEGTEVLKAEQTLGRELVNMLDAEQAKVAILPDPAPNDIVTFVQQKVELDNYAGLAAGQMTDAQRAKLEELLGAYLNNMNADIAKKQWNKLQESGLDKLYFAWMGGTKAGEPHYYRIHGPTLLIEYDNVQNGNNHIHSVWRDLTDDFGEDLLREHYAHGHKH
jgi:hypothetical protein